VAHRHSSPNEQILCTLSLLLRTSVRVRIDLSHPYGSLARGRFEGKACGIRHLAKNERDAPNFLYAALDRTACAPFF
jgi:hypothetical protein